MPKPFGGQGKEWKGTNRKRFRMKPRAEKDTEKGTGAPWGLIGELKKQTKTHNKKIKQKPKRKTNNLREMKISHTDANGDAHFESRRGGRRDTCS